MISAVLIVRNEAPRLEACIASIRPHVDEIVIVDTGSIDGTDRIAERLADKFERFTWNEDFAEARNFATSLATHPWIFWCDGDDVVQGAENLRRHAEEMDAKRGDRPSMLMVGYEYQRDAEGRVVQFQTRERLYTPRSAFVWQEPIHEVLCPIAPECMFEKCDDIRVVHSRAGKVHDVTRNLRILRHHYDSGYQSTRSLYYLGLEYGHVGDTGQSIEFLRRYVGMSYYKDEKAFACIELSNLYEKLQDYHLGLDWAWKAMQVREGWFEPYYAAGKAYYYLAMRGGPEERRNWERCLFYLELALSLPPTVSALITNPLERSHEVHKFLNVALSKLGHHDRAMQSCLRGLEAKPDESLAENASLLTRFLAKRELDRCLGVLGGTYEPPAGPEELAPGKLNIVVFTGHAWEPWTPETAAKNGIGGSETACIEMTKRWAADGHRVRVFGDCAALEGTYDGVEYLHHEKFAGTSADVLVASRRPDAVDDGRCDAPLKFQWVHDMHLGPHLTHDRALHTDRVLVLSEWHKGCLLHHHPQIHPDQVTVTRNGIDLGRFEPIPESPSPTPSPKGCDTASHGKAGEAPGRLERNPHRAIYSSSPDRGLEVLLKCWPAIRERVPDATLEVFYGFEIWEGMARGNAEQLEHIERLKQMLRDAEPLGVTFFGRQPQSTIAAAMLSSGVWAYPTWFSETSCITAMEAQAAGLYIVTSPIAALNETVGSRAYAMIDGDWLSDEYQEQFVMEVVGAMNVPDEESGRSRIQLYAIEHFGWDSLATDWIDMFKATPAGVMPPYKGFAP